MNDPGNDDEADLEERAAAEALARAFDGEDAGTAADREFAGMIGAAAGRSAPLGEIRARGLARDAVLEVQRRARRARRPRWPWAMLGVAASVAIALLAMRVVLPEPAPEHLRSRSAGRLVPGPFPKAQTAAERLDRVAADRLIAFREVRSHARGRR
ncbi:MAG: hypothetical protein EXR72_20945 [Myxococcales bacterium]|nr:hypothetical protein [Myxococcales bacterium]